MAFGGPHLRPWICGVVSIQALCELINVSVGGIPESNLYCFGLLYIYELAEIFVNVLSA